MQYSTTRLVSALATAVLTLPVMAVPVTSISDKTVYVPGSMPATPIASLVDYAPADADELDFTLTPLMVPTPDRYVVSDGTIEVLPGARDAIFTVSCTDDPSVKGLLGFTVNPYPVTSVSLAGIEGDDITLDCMDILALRTEVEPAESVNRNVVITLSDMSRPGMATTYSVGGSEKFTELVTYYPGTLTLTLSALENPGIKHVYNVTVNPLESDGTAGDRTGGTFWLNEDWFTHKDGSVNYLVNPVPADDSEIEYNAYARANADGRFGATSQYGMIFADKLFVMSKQAHDSGDLRGTGGGRLVVADARTLRTLASWDEIGGDGRACVGVDSRKAYIGTNAGIRVLTWDGDDFTLADANIAGIGNDTGSGPGDIGNNQALYNKQVGDMVKSGQYVFAIQQQVGVHVIDTADDTVVRTIPDTGVQGVTRASDGRVWYASNLGATPDHTWLHCIDSATAEECDSQLVPGTIGCSWGSWRSTNFFASRTSGDLFWNGGTSSVTSSGSAFYRWNPADGDASALEPFYTFSGEEGTFPGLYQFVYGSMRYDDRTGCVLFASTTEPSGNYRYNWLNFVDAESGEKVSTVRMRDYYWFPALPIFPDKYAPEFNDIPAVTLDHEDTAVEINLAEVAHDEDNPDTEITVSWCPTPELEKIARVSRHGDILSLLPVSAGSADLKLRAESNGRETYAFVPVTSSVGAGVDGTGSSMKSISVAAGKIRLRGLDGTIFTVCDTAGAAVLMFRAEGDECTVATTLPAGVYVLSDVNGAHTLKFTL